MDNHEFLKGKTVLITGGLGFIGSNLANKLVKLKKEGIIKKIIIIDSLIEGCGGSLYNVNEIKDEIEIHNIDIGDEKINPIIKETDIVFNLAGQTGHSASMENPFLDLNLNYLSQLKFLESCRKNNPDIIIIFASTRQVYGIPKYLPVNEEHPLNPPDINGIHKLAAEELHNMFNKIYGLKICSLRLTNIYGPRQRIKDSKLGVLGYFIGLSLKKKPITLFLPGTQIRDMNYIDDLIEAFLLSAENIEKTNGKIYNIGGEKTTLLDFAKTLIKINSGEYELKPFPPEKKKIDIEDYYSDYSKFKEITGWKPKISLEQGIKKTLDFYKNNLNHYMDSIPPFDLKKQYENIKTEINEAVFRVLKNGFFILGNELENFEKEFALFCNKKYAIGLNSGTDALELALRAVGIEKGDEVIAPANTAIPTIVAISEIGATPVLVDCNNDFLIDPNKIEEKITSKTRAIIPVHLYGQSCDMDRISDIAKKYNLFIIEDCCQAHGALYKGKKVPVSDIGCFSFYPSKNLGAYGDAGMIVTDSEDIKNKIKLLRNYGQSDRYHAATTGRNSRLDEIQAAILRVKLKHLDSWNNLRKEKAEFYNLLLKNIEDLETPKNEAKGHVYHLYVIKTKKQDELMNYLKEKNILTLIHYPIPIHLQNAFSYLGYKQGDFPNSERFAKEILSLPLFPEITEKEQEEVAGRIREFFENV